MEPARRILRPKLQTPNDDWNCSNCPLETFLCILNSVQPLRLFHNPEATEPALKQYQHAGIRCNTGLPATKVCTEGSRIWCRCRREHRVSSCHIACVWPRAPDSNDPWRRWHVQSRLWLNKSRGETQPGVEYGTGCHCVVLLLILADSNKLLPSYLF